MASRKRRTASAALIRRDNSPAGIARRIKWLEAHADATTAWVDEANRWIRSVDKALQDIKRADPKPDNPKWPPKPPRPGGVG